MRWDSNIKPEPHETLVMVDRSTPLGNPIYMKEKSVKERENVIQQYRVILNKDIIKKGPMYVELMKIVDLLDKGVDVALGCHCAPSSCHAEVIKNAAEYLLKKNFRIRSRFHKDGSTPHQQTTIFVFGSNLRGRHGKGAALIAAQQFGAIEGQADGLMGRSFGIPTKDENLQPIPLHELEIYFGFFCAYAKLNPDKKFFVTRVGCGLAGNKDEDIAGLVLKLATMIEFDMKNCSFPEEWKRFLIKEQK